MAKIKLPSISEPAGITPDEKLMRSQTAAFPDEQNTGSVKRYDDQIAVDDQVPSQVSQTVTR